MSDDPTVFDPASVVFIFVCTTLVFFMTPGLAYFYGGLVRARNMNLMLMQNLFCCGWLYIVWWVVGFSISFGKTMGGYFGNPADFFYSMDVPIHTPIMRDGAPFFGLGLPGILFQLYFGMFAIITPPLIVGAIADRMKFKPYMAFVTLWSLLVYCPACHWIWGYGFLAKMGVWDWAGGYVVHTTAGFSALAGALLLGKRTVPQGAAELDTTPHHIPFVALGTAILWFGWFGFNGGSALAANDLAMLSAANSQISACVMSVGWVGLDVLRGGKPSMVSFCVGAVAGLVVITPLCGYVSVHTAFVAAFVGLFMCYNAVLALNKAGIDDALDVFGVHGVGGFTGCCLIGLLADDPECLGKHPPKTCASPGLVAKGTHQFLLQLGAAVFVAVYAFAVTWVIIVVLRVVMQVTPQDQDNLDDEEHGEAAYYASSTYTKLQASS